MLGRGQRLITGLIFALVLGAAPAAAQTVIEGPGFPLDTSAGGFTPTHLAGQVHMLTGGGGNLGVFAGEDGIYLVDDRYEPLTGKLVAAIAAISTRPIRFLINTHFHGDHTGANAHFGATGVVIVAHDNVRKTLSKPHFIEALRTRFAAMAPGGLPLITFSDEITFHLNGEEVFVFHAPAAHTDGDSIIYFRGSDVVATGDVYQRRGYPVVDRSNGGSISGLIRAWDRLLATIGEDTKILQGHGGVSNRAELGRARDNLVTIRDRIATLIKDGKTVGEVVAAKPTAGYDSDWPPRPLSPDVIVEWLYAELSG